MDGADQSNGEDVEETGLVAVCLLVFLSFVAVDSFDRAGGSL